MQSSLNIAPTAAGRTPDSAGTPVPLSPPAHTTSAVATPSRTRGRGKILLVVGYTLLVFNYSLVSLLAPFFPSQASRSWGFSELQIGLVMSMDPLGEILCAFVSVSILKRFGAYRCNLVALVLNALSSGVFGFAPDLFEWCDSGLSPDAPSDALVATMLIMRLLNGFATCLGYVALFESLSIAFPTKIGTISGDMMAWSGVGYIFGPPMGGLLYTVGANTPVGGFAMPFAVFTAVLLVLILPPAALLLPRDVPAAPEAPLATSVFVDVDVDVDVDTVHASGDSRHHQCCSELREVWSVATTGASFAMATMFIGVLLTTAYMPILEPRLTYPDRRLP